MYHRIFSLCPSLYRVWWTDAADVRGPPSACASDSELDVDAPPLFQVHHRRRLDLVRAQLHQHVGVCGRTLERAGGRDPRHDVSHSQTLWKAPVKSLKK